MTGTAQPGQKGCVGGCAEAFLFLALLTVAPAVCAAAGVLLAALLTDSPAVAAAASAAGFLGGLGLAIWALMRLRRPSAPPAPVDELAKFESELVTVWEGEDTPIITFAYSYADGGRVRRQLVPIRISRHPERGLYVYGWCTRASDFRTFKIASMSELEVDRFGEMPVAEWLERGFGIR